VASPKNAGGTELTPVPFMEIKKLDVDNYIVT
jgi:hypothetical protein